MDSKDAKRKADNQGRQLEREKQGLEVQLNRIELKLKALDLLTKRIGIVAAVVGLLVTALNIGLGVFQLKLTRAQASEQTEKNRVNLRYGVNSSLSELRINLFQAKFHSSDLENVIKNAF